MAALAAPTIAPTEMPSPALATGELSPLLFPTAPTPVTGTDLRGEMAPTAPTPVTSTDPRDEMAPTAPTPALSPDLRDESPVDPDPCDGAGTGTGPGTVLLDESPNDRDAEPIPLDQANKAPIDTFAPSARPRDIQVLILVYRLCSVMRN
jgi:hypothetical protein